MAWIAREICLDQTSGHLTKLHVELNVMKIKSSILMGAAIVILSTLAARADDWMSDHFYYDTNHKQAFNANELSFDAFGSLMGHERTFLAWPNTSIRDHNGSWGGGIGANYFWSQDVGIGVDAGAQDGTQRFIDHVGGNLLVRFPIQPINLAPYVFAGGGRAFNPGWNWYGDAGFGLEFRLNPKFGIFSDARYIWKDIAHNDEALVRAGIRLVF
jgi:hypothetical protein